MTENPYVIEAFGCNACRDATYRLVGGRIEVRCTECEGWDKTRRAVEKHRHFEELAPPLTLRDSDLTAEERSIERERFKNDVRGCKRCVRRDTEGDRYQTADDPFFQRQCAKEIAKWRFLRGLPEEAPAQAARIVA